MEKSRGIGTAKGLPKIIDNSNRADFGNPGGGWRKIVLRGVLRGGGVDLS